MEKKPFLVPPPAPGGPTKIFLQMGKSRPWDESNKKNLKSLAGLEAEISMERTDGRTDGRQTDGRKCEHISVTTIVGYAKNESYATTELKINETLLMIKKEIYLIF